MNLVAWAGGSALMTGAIAFCSWISRSALFSAVAFTVALVVATIKDRFAAYQTTATAKASSSQRSFYKTMNCRTHEGNKWPWTESTLIIRESSMTSSTSYPSSNASSDLGSLNVDACEQLVGKLTAENPTRMITTEYCWGKSTEANHRLLLAESNNDSTHIAYKSPFAQIRRKLDHSFHAEYCPERQRFQDSVIQSMLQQKQLMLQHGRCQMSASCCYTSVDGRKVRSLEVNSPNSKRAHWIVFSAGAMGAGKTWTVKLLHDKGRFPLDKFLMVDPDVIRHCLPEFETYVKLCPDKAGELTRMESGMMAEILVKAALDQGRNVLVDGSLRNASWYLSYFEQLRQDHEGIRIAILHVTAPRNVILTRALRRSEETGRVVPVELLEQVIAEVPISYQMLRPHADLAVEIRNFQDDADDVELSDPEMDWSKFQQFWEQP